MRDEAGRRSGRVRADIDPLVAALTLLGPLLGMSVMLNRTITDDVIDRIVDARLPGVEVVS